jgi:hypothetical protein
MAFEWGFDNKTLLVGAKNSSRIHHECGPQRFGQRDHQFARLFLPVIPNPLLPLSVLVHSLTKKNATKRSPNRNHCANECDRTWLHQSFTPRKVRSVASSIDSPGRIPINIILPLHPSDIGLTCVQAPAQDRYAAPVACTTVQL